MYAFWDESLSFMKDSLLDGGKNRPAKLRVNLWTYNISYTHLHSLYSKQTETLSLKGTFICFFVSMSSILFACQYMRRVLCKCFCIYWNPICKLGGDGVCNLSTCEAEGGGLQIQPGLPIEFKASVASKIRDYLKYLGLKASSVAECSPSMPGASGTTIGTAKPPNPSLRG